MKNKKSVTILRSFTGLGGGESEAIILADENYAKGGDIIFNKFTSKQKELLEKIKEFRLIDDDFMSKVFEDNYECIELLLHIIMGKADLKVKEAHTQYNIKNLVGRSVRLDIHAIDNENKKYNIEIQRSEKGAEAKRARYHSSVMDANSLLPGSNFDDLPETYVIFITETDVMGGNEPLYHINRIVNETGKNFGDEAHIIYVNAAFEDDTPLGRLMHDFLCKNPLDMYYKILADKTKYYKEDEKGVAVMCKIIEELIDNEKKESALRMLEDGELSLEKIAKYAGLTLEQVKELSRLQTV